MKTILVTGAAGFIGSNLVKKIYKELPEVQVIGIDNMNDYYDVRLKEERLKELMGEGYRMSDLRRWGLGFARNPEHPENPYIDPILLNTGKGLSYNAGDHRFVWPIPTSEIEANPQLDGQQNPGY